MKSGVPGKEERKIVGKECKANENITKVGKLRKIEP
jgi:hypothetical protein